MATVSIDIEIASSFPAEKLFKAFSDFEIIAPKINPSVFKSVETVEGDGGVGTIKVITFGDAVPFTNSKYKVVALDASTFSYTHMFYEGGNLMGIQDLITHHVKITPSTDGGCVYKLTVVYSCKGDEKPSEEFL
ncbi:root allergen protein-like [Rutidosis leptorrhynchoides]|uniref:root allergen protein-like n=1 Tax=Rutidosis leptorrhynchoides TaxID=125765 RepID=UPI003A98D8F2